jgi:MFS transporter, DHA1 family, multidrug resistance protein
MSGIASGMPASNSQDSVDAGAFILLLAAVFIVMLGYGILLPILPFLLGELLGDAGNVAISWHTGMLAGTYMFALFVFATAWGAISDRIGRRPVILAGLGGYLLMQALFGLQQSLWAAYGVRAMAGLFAAAVLPVALAYVSDTVAENSRARRFAWISAASLLGLLFGPAFGGWVYGTLAADPVLGASGNSAAMLPFYASAILGVPVLVGAHLRLHEPKRLSFHAGARPQSRGTPVNRALPVLLLLSLLVMFGLGSFEVGIALQGQQALGLGPARIAVMFVECSIVMIIAQVLFFSSATAVQRLKDHRVTATSFLVMAGGLLFLPGGKNFYFLLLPVGLIAAGSGILLPLLAHLTSLQAGSNPGATLGMQTAAASLGQALGSVAGGWLFGALAGASFWITAGLMLGAAAVAFNLRTYATGENR